MPPDYTELKRLIERQGVLLEENTKMLRKVRRYQILAFFSSLLWYGLIIGLPFALYYYVLGPYAEALGFTTDIQNIPGYSQFEAFFGDTDRQ